MSTVIKEIEAVAVDLTLREPLATSRHTYRSIPYVFVRVLLANGVVGYGEARETVQITGETGNGIVDAIRTRLRPAVLDRDAADIEGLHRAFDSVLDRATSAKSAVDIAVYDALGQSLGVPASTLMGGVPRGPIASSKAISVASTAAMVCEARSHFAAGYRTVKVKTGIDADAEYNAIAAIRAEIGAELNIKLDANQAWSLQQAARFLDRVERFDIQMVEQPLPAWDLTGSAELRRRTPIPVILDEAVHSPVDARKAIEAGACDYINIKLCKTGGLYPALKLVAVAESAGVACQIGTLDTAIGSAAAVHLVHARPSIRFAEINGPTRLERDIATGFLHADGRSDVSPGPGLGLVTELSHIGFANERRESVASPH
jgi:L-alanine-DL-glutamate epimerase-like enolase superfamily enzyme